MRAKIPCLFGLLILATVTTIGCGDEDPAGPLGGTITINPEPNSINAPWELMGLIVGQNSIAISGTGDAVLADMPAGTYMLDWKGVSGWNKPLGERETLVVGGKLIFSTTYIPQTGTISAIPLRSGRGSYLDLLPSGSARPQDRPRHRAA